METQAHRHAEDGELLARLDGELDAAETAALEAHLASCAACAERETELRFAARRVSSALSELDVESPLAEMPAALRRKAEAAPIPIERARRGARTGRRSLATAAGLTLLVAAGAYAIPGSPVRGWVNDSIDAVAGLFGSDVAPEPEASPSTVSVEPADGAIVVSVQNPAEGLRIVVGVTSEPEASASSPDGAFRVETGRVEVSGASGELRILLPAGAASARVVVGDLEVAEIRDGEVVLTADAGRSPAEILLAADG